MSSMLLSADGTLMTLLEPAGLDFTIPLQFQTTTDQIPSGSFDDMEERRRVRRKISNRESARRSRMRKQQKLDELENRANQLGVLNKELANRITALDHQRLLFLMDNQRLRFESDSLRHRLSDLTTILLLRGLPKMTANSSINEPYMMPLINYVVEIN